MNIVTSSLLDDSNIKCHRGRLPHTLSFFPVRWVNVERIRTKKDGYQDDRREESLGLH